MATRDHGRPALEIENLSKRFGGALALDGVCLTVCRGEVHGLLGQNGSGKSTLIKILSGFHEPEPGGSLNIYEQQVGLPLAPGLFRQLGLAFVHQHLGLVPSLTVAENICLSDFATDLRWRIDWDGERTRVLELMGEYGLAIDPDARIGELSQVDRCMVAIVRALDEVRSAQAHHGGDGILVLDEPTPFLPRADVERLFGLVRQIVARGASVIFVSHDVDEILEITDRATVLRDGKVAGTVDTDSASHDDFIEMIVGKRVDAYKTVRSIRNETGQAVIVEALTGAICKQFSVSIAPGEVLGLTGLIGAGFDEVPALLYGARKPLEGTLTVDGTTFNLAMATPESAIGHGIAYLPADRLAESGAGSLPVSDNMTLPSINRFLGRFGLRRNAMLGWAHEKGVAHQVRPNDPFMNLGNLSGGNQQKVLLAKWLELQPRMLLLDEPTQGVDVGARQQVFAAIDNAARAGTVVICASTDAEQLAQICNRVLVFAQGRVAAELTGSDITKEEITYQCYTGTASTDLALAV